VNVYITMSQHAGYVPPPLPKKNNRSWSKDELEVLNSQTGAGYLWTEVVSGAFREVIGEIIGVPGVGAITTAAVAAILQQDIQTDRRAYLGSNL
jgi:hypothetical protein